MGCSSCSAKNLVFYKKAVKGKDVLNNLKMVSESIFIDRTKFNSNDTLSILKYLYCLDKKALSDSFAKIGIKVDSVKDLEILNDLHSSGRDVSGEIKNATTGEPISFNVIDVVKNIEVSSEKFATCSAQFV